MADDGAGLLWWSPALLFAGLVAGFVNTLAGGGSLISIPVLLLLGLPPHLANATNRVAVFAQSVTSAIDFDRGGRLDRGAIVGSVAPTLAGALVGAVAAARMPADLLEPVLLGALLLIAVLLLWKPSTLAPPEGTPVLSLGERPAAAGALFLIGVYGGFVQAGVGIFLLSTLSGLLRYDLVRANALKVLIVAAFTGLSLAVFLWEGQVLFLPGAILAIGTVAGARLAVRVALEGSQELLRRVVLTMAIVSLIAAWMR